MSLYNGIQDPRGDLGWSLNWSAWLAGDTIATSTWSVEGGDGAMSINSEGFSDVRAVVKVSGGTVGQTYRLINEITTADGDRDRRTIQITIEER